MDERLRKWRLILGNKADPDGSYSLEVSDTGMDEVLEALYDSDRKGSLGASSPNVNRWLGDIRKFFPSSVVQIMQRDAMEGLGLKQMLLEPELLESIEADVHLVATILSLQKVMPDKTRRTAKEVVRKVVEELEKKLRNPMRQAIEGSINRSTRNRRPRASEIDWNQTIRKNLKHFQKDLNTIIPETLIGYGRKGRALRDVIILIDQSGSMASSLVYASVFGAVMASLKSIKTHLICFDTAIADLTENLHDPVELLFSAQLGGGTDINMALAYAEKLIRNPSDTIVVLISDLFEGGNLESMLQRAKRIKGLGVQFISLLALSDQGTPIYDGTIAQQFVNMGIPAFACTPDAFPEVMGKAVRKDY